MPGDGAGQRRSRQHVQHRVPLDCRLLAHLLDQRQRDQQLLAKFAVAVIRDRAAVLTDRIDLDDGIFEIGAVGDRAVAGQGPRRRRPDYRRRAGKPRQARRHDREAHPNRIRAVVVVFDLGFGQRGLLDDRPQDRLRALVQPAIDKEFADLAHDLRLGVEAHRQIRVVPVADDAEPLELLLLYLDPARREIAAFLAELRQRHAVLRLLLGAVFFLDDPLDRQAVAVPARHIRRVLAGHLLRPVDDILQDLVQRVPEMEVAVRIRRPVMQHEFFPAARGLAQLFVKAHIAPARDQLRFERRQPAAHREIGFRKKDGRTVIRRHGQLVLMSAMK